MQLRALARAAVHGNVKVMLPMVAVPAELERAGALLDEAVADLAGGRPAACPSAARHHGGGAGGGDLGDTLSRRLLFDRLQRPDAVYHGGGARPRRGGRAQRCRRSRRAGADRQHRGGRGGARRRGLALRRRRCRPILAAEAAGYGPQGGVRGAGGGGARQGGDREVLEMADSARGEGGPDALRRRRLQGRAAPGARQPALRHAAEAGRGAGQEPLLRLRRSPIRPIPC